jgi:hypothetical protein
VTVIGESPRRRLLSAERVTGTRWTVTKQEWPSPACLSWILYRDSLPSGGWRQLHTEELHNLYYSPVGLRIVSTSSRPTLGLTQPPIQRAQGGLFPGVKRPGREAHHSLPDSAEVKKMCVYTSAPQPFSTRGHHDSTRHTKMLFPSKTHDIRQLIPKQCYKRQGNPC